MVGHVRGKRGAVAIQFALFLPILVVALIGGFEVWKILYVRDSLNDATYQAVRLLAMQPNAPGIDGQVDALVRRSAAMNPLIGNRAFDPGRLWVALNYDARCGRPVTVRVGLAWVVGEGWGRPSSGWFPFLGRAGTLRTQATGWVLCERDSDVH